MTCETCVFRDVFIDGVFCIWYAESVTGTVENCPHYTPMEEDEDE